MRSLIALIVALSGVVWIQYHYPQTRLTDNITFEFNETFANYSAETLTFTTFGYRRAASALLWLRFLQQTPPRKVEPGQVSWIYRDLDVVTLLDPAFYPAYESGGAFLSVITEDKLGAEKILLKGIREFPRRWRLYSYLGYHYQFEMNDPLRAGETWLAGSRLPDAPPILALRASSHLAKVQNVEAGIEFLENLLKQATDPGVRGKLEEKLSRLRKSGGK